MKENTTTIDFGAIEPYCILKTVLHNLWMIVCAGIIGLLVSSMVLAISFAPEYTSSLTFVVSSRSGVTTYNVDTTAAAQTAATFSKLLQSSLMKNIAAEEMGVSSISGDISAEQVAETNLITVNATADNPKDAFLIIKAVEKNYAKVSDYISRTAVLRVLDSPSVSTTPSNIESTRKLTMACGGACGFLMLALVIFIFIKRDTVQNREGAKQKLDGRLLAVIPHEYDKGRNVLKILDRKKKQSENLLIDAPTRSYGFCESMKMVSARLEHEKEKGNTVFMFTSISESEGKSTVSANTAISLCEKGYKVLLIDMDTRKPAQRKLLLKDIDHFTDFGAMLENESLTPNEVIAKAFCIKKHGLNVLLNNRPYLAVADKLFSGRMAEILNIARKKFDYVIIDTPPMGYFADSEAMTEYADGAVLVVRQNIVPAGDINDGIDNIQNGKAKFLGVILNDAQYLFPSASVYGYGSYGYSKKMSRYGYGYGYGSSENAKKK